MPKTTRETCPGIKEGLALNQFSIEEKAIIKYLSQKYWYVTNVSTSRFGNSIIKFVLVKPVPYITTAFNLTREVIVAFSPYDTIEPRVVDFIEEYDCAGVRTEEVCSIVISKDPNVEDGINAFTKTNQESRIIIPFSYEELTKQESDDYFLERLRKCFYSRDLFGIQDPLKTDAFFFGRNDIIQELVNKHLCGDSAGLFGLRKTGKTSILYGIKRVLDKKTAVTVMLDCQVLHLKTWNLALKAVIDEAKNVCSVKKTHLSDPALYDNTSKAMDAFYSDIQSIYYHNGRRSMLLVFDEIENISFKSSASENWKSGIDFLKFWQVIRSTYQKLDNNVFTFLIAGTNPSCVEQQTIGDTDNPIFSQLSPTYIPPFDFQLTLTMLEKLGGYMGMSFSPEVCARIVTDYGGHPMLMRQMCSFIHKNITESRPFSIDIPFYEQVKEKFDLEGAGLKKYIQMVLEVLDKWYSDEYEMLKMLALGDYDSFIDFAALSAEYTTHLLNYGLIEYSKSAKKYVFKISTIQDYLCEQNKYKRVSLTEEDKRREISERRNAIEPKLRDIVRRTLKSHLGEAEAKNKVIKHLYDRKDWNKYKDSPYKDLFDPNKHKIFLKTLFDIIISSYDPIFKHIFVDNIDVFRSKSDFINHCRKPDAHAAEISENDFTAFRGAMGWLEQIVEENI